MRRRIVPALCGLLLAAVAAGVAPASLAGQQLPRLGWLSGCWEGSQGRAMFEEQWMRPRGGMMLGMGRVTVGDSVVSHESLRIVERGGRVVYIAQPDGRSPVEFEARLLEEGQVRFANPAHDHPKAIVYRRAPPDSLLAHISGDPEGMQVAMQFRMVAVPCGSAR